MTFKIRKLDHRAWPVTVTFQECDAQGVVTEVEQTFVAHWKPVTEKERKAITAAVDSAHPLPEGDPRYDIDALLARNADYFARLVVGWGPEVLDETGAPKSFSATALTALITGTDGLAFSSALVRADNEIRYGLAPLKNSKPSPAPGETSGAGEGAISSPTT
jgi:hypothetical protein